MPSNITTSPKPRRSQFLTSVRMHKATPITLVTLIYTGLTLFMTYPVAWQISEGIVGSPGDTYQHLWAFWWAKIAIIDLKTTLADVSMLYHPQGAYHPLLWVTPWIQLVGLPFMLLFGPFVTYNTGFLFTVIFSGVTTYMLAYEISGDRRAAFVGGLIFAFAPTRFVHALGHYAQTMTYLFPLFALFLVKFLKKPGLKLALITGGLLATSLLVNFLHLALVVIPISLVLVGNYAWTQWRGFWEPKRFGGLVFIVVVAVLLTSPFFFPFIKAQLNGNLDNLASPGVSKYGADLLAFLTPSPLHPIFKNSPSLRQAFLQITGVGFKGTNITEGVVYIGFIPLALAIWGSWKQKISAQPWILLGLITAVLSLGVFLKINGKYIVYRADELTSYFILPYALLTKLPFYDAVRTPSRINMTTMLALAILASLGLATILRTIERHPARQWLVAIGLTPIILFEYVAVWPLPMAREPVPAFYAQVAQEPGDFAILDYPMYLLGHQSAHSFDFPMYYQLVHERPIAGGYAWRLPPNVNGTMRALNNLVAPNPQTDIMPTVPFDERARILNQLNFGYVVLHKQDTQFRTRKMPEDELVETTAHLVALLGKPVYDDPYITAFHVPDGSDANDILFLALGENWDNREGNDGSIWRWTTGQRSKIYVYGDSDQAQQLTFTLQSIQGPRHVKLLVNDEFVGEMVVEQSRQFISPPFFLPLEQNSIILEVEEECRRSDEADIDYQETPCRNLRISNLELNPAQSAWGDHSLNCSWGNEITLLGYDLEDINIEPGESIQLTLYWQASKRVDDSFTVFTHVLNAEDQILAQQDNLPIVGTAPTNWWMPGEIILDPYTILIPENTPEQTKSSLTVGMYLLSSGQRLSVDETCPGTSINDFVTLSAIDIVKEPR